MKTIKKPGLAICLLLSMALSLLSACQSPPGPETPQEPAFSALELAMAVSDAAADKPDTPKQFDSSSSELLNAYMEAAYGLSGGEWADCAVITASDMRAYEIAVLRFDDEASAEHGAACLEQYAASREAAFFGYAPEQAALVSNAVICQEGLYTGLFICEDPDAARDLFTTILTTGVLPEPAPTPEPEPVPEPEDEPPVDMLRLMAGMIESCIDEIDALGGVTYLASDIEYRADFFYERAATSFDIDAESVEAGFFVDDWGIGDAFKIYVLCMADETAAGQALDGLRQYRADRESASLEGREPPRNAERMAAGLEVQSGRYAAQFIGADPQAMADAFEAELERLETEQLPEPVEQPQPVLNEDGLKALMGRFQALCQDDADAADLVSYSVNDRNIFSTLYEIASDQWAAALTLYGRYEFEVDLDGRYNEIKSYSSLGTNGDAFELAVLCMTDEAAAIRNEATLQLHAWSTRWTLKNGIPGLFDPPETVRADSRVIRDGRYLALFTCRDPEAVEAVFEAALSELLSTHGEENTPPRGTAEEPLFFEWEGMVQPGDGDPDPDYPDRFLYVPPEDEPMTRYDTDLILAAWAKRDPSGLSEYDRAIYDSAEEVLSGLLRSGMSDLEKEIVIYDWVTQNIVYDRRHTSVLDEMPETSYTPYGGLVEHTGVCLGYASTFELLMDMAGIECATVIGACVNSTGAHAWDMVRLNGEWYCVDPTWDKDSPRWEWAFFNVTTEYMARTNHQWDYANIPEATATDHGRR